MSGDEFVPSGDEYQFRVEFERPAPLFLEVITVQISVHARVESFQYAEIPSVSVFHVEGSAVSFAVGRGVLGHADRNLFEPAVGPFYVAVLRIDFKPAPLVFARRERAVHVVGLSGPEREEVADRPVFGRIGQVVRISHDTGLAFPHEPQVFVTPRFVNVFVELAQRYQRVRSRAERQHESDLRHVYAVLLRLIPGLH